MDWNECLGFDLSRVMSILCRYNFINFCNSLLLCLCELSGYYYSMMLLIWVERDSGFSTLEYGRDNAGKAFLKSLKLG